MSRHDRARLMLGNYRHTIEVQTRFQDLDPLGHVNNVAVAAIFETARMRFHVDLVQPLLSLDGESRRWLVARADINYLGEIHYPASVIVASANGALGRRSRQTISAAFQNGLCVALCDTTLVCTDPVEEPIGPAARQALSALLLGPTARD